MGCETLSERVIFIAGPTASGKSQIGIELAKRIRGEILSLDAYAVYRRMDIGTAKPTPAERAEVPHHLIDLVEPYELFDVAKYLTIAHKTVTDILNRDRTPIFVGGTPMYLRMLVSGIFDGPPANETLRRQLESELAGLSAEAITAKLARVDPVSAARLHPNNRRRIIRALEVFTLTGKPISEWQTQWERPTPKSGPKIFVPEWERAELYDRINRRVEKMFAMGLVEEVRRLRAEPRGFGRTAATAIGYREVLEYLDGHLTLPLCVEQVQAHTRQFSRRQWTFLRSFPESQLRRIPMNATVTAEWVAATILAERMVM